MTQESDNTCGDEREAFQKLSSAPQFFKFKISKCFISLEQGLKH
jgi:hypothetical protein